MAIAISFPGSNVLGRSVAPIFRLTDHFLYRLSTFSGKKEKKICLLEVWTFLQNALSNSVFLAPRFSVRLFQMPLEGLRFVGNIGIIYETDPILQNMTKIVCLRWPTFDIFICRPLYTIVNYMRQLFRLISLIETKLVTPNLFLHFSLTQVTHYLTAVDI